MFWTGIFIGLTIGAFLGVIIVSLIMEGKWNEPSDSF